MSNDIVIHLDLAHTFKPLQGSTDKGGGGGE